MSRTCTLLLGAAIFFGCASEDPTHTSKDMEKRMREMEKLAKESLPKIMETALSQKVDPEIVKKAQAELRVLKEYMDEPHGKIDGVTVNAVMAFERRVGLEDDGLLDEETRKRLEEAAAAASS